MPYGKKDGSIAYKGDIVRFQSGPSSFTVGNLSIANVDSIESLSVLEALNANTTRNSIALGLPMPGLQASMDVSLDFIPGTTPHFTGDKLKADLRISLGLGGFRSLIELLLKLNTDTLTRLQIGQILNINCLASAINPGGLVIKKLSTSIREFAFTMECLECSDSALIQLEKHLRERDAAMYLTHLANKYSQKVSDIVTSPNAERSVTIALKKASDKCISVEETEIRESSGNLGPLSNEADATIAIVVVTIVIGIMVLLLTIMARRAYYVLYNNQKSHGENKVKVIIPLRI